MKAFTYSEARQNLAKLMTMAQSEEIEIRHKDGRVFSLRAKPPAKRSPFDIAGIDNTSVTTADILKAVRASRQRPQEKRPLKARKREMLI